MEYPYGSRTSKMTVGSKICNFFPASGVRDLYWSSTVDGCLAYDGCDGNPWMWPRWRNELKNPHFEVPNHASASALTMIRSFFSPWAKQFNQFSQMAESWGWGPFQTYQKLSVSVGWTSIYQLWLGVHLGSLGTIVLTQMDPLLSEAKPYDLFRAYAQSLGAAGAPQIVWQFEILEIVLQYIVYTLYIIL